MTLVKEQYYSLFSSEKKGSESPNLTYIDLEAGKAAKRLTESRCQDVTFTVVIPAGLKSTHTQTR